MLDILLGTRPWPPVFFFSLSLQHTYRMQKEFPTLLDPIPNPEMFSGILILRPNTPFLEPMARMEREIFVDDDELWYSY